jgi:hypothetical protein
MVDKSVSNNSQMLKYTPFLKDKSFLKTGTTISNPNNISRLHELEL